MKVAKPNRPVRVTTVTALALSLLVGTAAYGDPQAEAVGGKSGEFYVRAVDKKDSSIASSAGITPRLVSPSEPDEDNGESVTEARYSLEGVSGNYYTRKSNRGGSEQPSILIPAFTIDGSSFKKERAWSIEIDRSKEPFSYLPPGDVEVKSGLPGWAKVSSTATKIIISSDSQRLGGKIKELVFPQLEFSYAAPEYSVAETVAELSEIDNTGRASLKVFTADASKIAYGKWSTSINAAPLREKLGASDGALSLNSSAPQYDPGFELTAVAGDSYVLSYSGNQQIKYIKGVDAVAAAESVEDTSEGYVNLSGILQYTAATSTTDGEFRDVSGSVALSWTRDPKTPTQITLTPKTVPHGKWSVDIDLSQWAKSNAGRTPVIQPQYSLVRKSGDIYTLSWNQTWKASASVTIFPK